MTCKHEWQGGADGVTCLKCGETMTAAEYAAAINGSAKKPKTKTDVKTAKK